MLIFMLNCLNPVVWMGKGVTLVGVVNREMCCYSRYAENRPSIGQFSEGVFSLRFALYLCLEFTPEIGEQ